jgi:hypothetical protein
MTWFLIAYFIGLFYLALNRDKIAGKQDFRTAWRLYAYIMITYAAASLLGMVPFSEIICNAVKWVLLGVSMFYLIKAMVPEETAEAKD